MKNSKLIIGLSMGFIGCKFYDSYKKVIKPKVSKIIMNAIILGENSKDFFMEVKQEAQEINKDSYRKVNYDCVNQNETFIPQRIDKLQMQLTDIQKQLSKL